MKSNSILTATSTCMANEYDHTLPGLTTHNSSSSNSDKYNQIVPPEVIFLNHDNDWIDYSAIPPTSELTILAELEAYKIGENWNARVVARNICVMPPPTHIPIDSNTKDADVELQSAFALPRSKRIKL